VEDERRAAVGARAASRFSGGIPEALGAELQALLPRQWTPSQLEEHAICPFRFFVGTVLRASEPASAEPDIDPRDEGSLAHAVLERFYRARIASGRARLVGAAEERQELIAAARAVFASFEADGRTGDPSVWASRRDVVQQRLERVIAAEAARADAAVPVLVEHRFGGAGGAPPLLFSDGTETVELRGRIDRIDASADGIVLIDYKDSRSPGPWREKLQRESLGLVNFQVPAYLMAARRAFPGKDRLEATYLLLRSAERVAPFAADAADPLFAVEPEARARARAEGHRPFADAVLEAVAAIRRGALPIASRDCSGCAFGAVCRFERRAEDAP
jgi:ATP-dependent helicase/DNAse subunit B